MALITGDNNNNTLTGTDGIDQISGLGGDDVLDGRAGGDTMAGGTGNDNYVVGSVFDVVAEAPDEGNNDTISSLIDFNLEITPFVESLSFFEGGNRNGRGNTLNNNLIGNDSVNSLYGLAGDDFLQGKSGNDYLDGGIGSDRMEGGTGNDVFIVDNAGDLVVENAGEGNDYIITGVSYTLGANVEDLGLNAEVTTPLDGTGNELNNTIFGNDTRNTLKGLAGNDLLRGEGDNDILDGGLGNDILEGGSGNDTYIVRDAADIITEATKAGTDLVQSSISYVLGENVENLTLTGRAKVNGTGNSANNVLIGNAGVNTLRGGAGKDILFSGAGRDTMVGGAGADRFVLGAPRSGLDRVQDFSKQQRDLLVLDVDDFDGLRLGKLRQNQFVKGSKALDSSDRFIYNERRGALFYDADGSGSGRQIQIATLGGKPALAAGDVLIVASPF